MVPLPDLLLTLEPSNEQESYGFLLAVTIIIAVAALEGFQRLNNANSSMHFVAETVWTHLDANKVN